VLVLDTNTVSIWLNPRDALYERLRQRLDRPDAQGFTTTVVNLQEQMRGWLAEIHRSRKPEEIVRNYHSLLNSFDGLRALKLLPFDHAAQALFGVHRPNLRRMGTPDLRIACVALANNATPLTRNLRDFRQVPGLAVEDWSR
jgi:tRNA(fMet)-specific endonuclease VapC